MLDSWSLRSSLLSKADRLWVHFFVCFIPVLISILASLLDAALAFTSYSPFINPALASPDLVVVEKDHLVWEDSRRNAVFFATGCVSSCHLIVASQASAGNPAGKKLLLFPIDGLFQDSLNFFGHKFKVNQAAGQINNGVVTYATKREGIVVYTSSEWFSL